MTEKAYLVRIRYYQLGFFGFETFDTALGPPEHLVTVSLREVCNGNKVTCPIHSSPRFRERHLNKNPTEDHRMRCLQRQLHNLHVVFTFFPTFSQLDWRNESQKWA